MTHPGGTTTANAALYDRRVYTNEGNVALLELLPSAAKDILDVGCGAGANARLMKRESPERRIVGITLSDGERILAEPHLDSCRVCDIELGIPEEIQAERYDAIVLSHVLEHLRFPQTELGKLSALLRPEGVLLIAVPNILAWRQRVQFLLGRFEYVSSGAMDASHLRFFTFDSVERELIAPNPHLQLKSKTVTGAVPLWFLRRILPSVMVRFLDRVGCQVAPNLFGDQVLIVATLAAH